MQNIQTTIQINASAEKIWQTLMDFEQYPNWNPFIQQISGQQKVGQQLEVHIHPPEQKPQVFNPIILSHSPNREFRWLGKLFIKGLFDGEHYFQIKSTGDQQCELIHGENFSGLLVKPILSLIREATTQGFIAMNEALKQQAEKEVV